MQQIRRSKSRPSTSVHKARAERRQADHRRSNRTQEATGRVQRSLRSERDDRVSNRPHPTRWRREEHKFRPAVEQHPKRHPRAETDASRRARRVPKSVTTSAIRAPASRTRNRTPGATRQRRPRAARGGARPRRYATTGARNGTPDGRSRRRRSETKPTFVERRTRAPEPHPKSARWCAQRRPRQPSTGTAYRGSRTTRRTATAANTVPPETTPPRREEHPITRGDELRRTVAVRHRGRFRRRRHEHGLQ